MQYITYLCRLNIVILLKSVYAYTLKNIIIYYFTAIVTITNTIIINKCY